MAMPHFFILKHQSLLISNLWFPFFLFNQSAHLQLSSTSTSVSFTHAPWHFTFHSPSKGCIDVYVCATRGVQCHENFLRRWTVPSLIYQFYSVMEDKKSFCIPLWSEKYYYCRMCTHTAWLMGLSEVNKQWWPLLYYHWGAFECVNSDHSITRRSDRDLLLGRFVVWMHVQLCECDQDVSEKELCYSENLLCYIG